MSSPGGFQSTRSARSATWLALLRWYMVKISIHALREERDSFIRSSGDPAGTFQSTRSARSATFGSGDS